MKKTWQRQFRQLPMTYTSSMVHEWIDFTLFDLNAKQRIFPLLLAIHLPIYIQIRVQQFETSKMLGVFILFIFVPPSKEAAIAAKKQHPAGSPAAFLNFRVQKNAIPLLRVLILKNINAQCRNLWLDPGIPNIRRSSNAVELLDRNIREAGNGESLRSPPNCWVTDELLDSGGQPSGFPEGFR